MKSYICIILVAVFLPLAGYCGNAPQKAGAFNTAQGTLPSLVTTASVSRAIPSDISALPLSNREMTMLETQQLESPQLLAERGAGCGQVWDPNTGMYHTVCESPGTDIILGATLGGLLTAFSTPTVFVTGILFGALGGIALCSISPNCN